MLCSKCNNEMRIQSSENVLREGKLYLDMHMVCINPQCSEHKKVVIITNEQPLKVEQN